MKPSMSPRFQAACCASITLRTAPAESCLEAHEAMATDTNKRNTIRLLKVDLHLRSMVVLLRTFQELVIQHQVDDNAGNRNVHPHWKRPARNAYMLAEAPLRGKKHSTQDHGHHDCR